MSIGVMILIVVASFAALGLVVWATWRCGAIELDDGPDASGWGGGNRGGPDDEGCE